ncbi:MAG: aldo/keto reductase [Solobacterium sp.]|nr:aldo/keto reductase [Solobacterium sp.]
MEFLPEKKLGFGLMRLPRNNPNDAADIDVEQVKQMVDLFIERGFTYFDTAWMYMGFNSEKVAGEALVSRHPRDTFTLSTKLHVDFVETKEDRDRIFNEQLSKTGAGYFDYYLLHAIEAGKYEKYEALDCFTWLAEKKAQGLVKHMGFSFHDTPELLDQILREHPEMEFVQLQLNYLDWESESVQSRACYEVARAHDKPVIVMEPVKGGTLASLPETAENMFLNHDPSASIPSWAVRFAASLPGVMMVLSGMSDLAQLDNNTSYMKEFVPLTEEETDMCFRAAGIINGQITIPCTSCHYCTEGCPMQICIPEYFALYNEAKREGGACQKDAYAALGADHGAASVCIACGQCENACPQHLPIIETLQDVALTFE